jgi:hypothetical protein
MMAGAPLYLAAGLAALALVLLGVGPSPSADRPQRWTG